jgi:hypothetical protein
MSDKGTERSTYDGGPAFPISLGIRTRDGETKKMDVNEGMSLRDYIATQALIGMIPYYKPAVFEGCGCEDITRACYTLADAMLKARCE